ncbi:glycoside hydrolase family 3 C-terminal domain-containing protein [Arthrobacter sp. Cr_A7]|uniref:beta-glucosidase n=1 Tax=Arthrobacter sp. Cr_A7 TaxID=3031017 RepID=UPI0023D9CFEE|nr:glycoside hydrolase family 3 C-terminal domain-containing protein [Arthrobacter sp. Cr_A7]MDF2049705.1 glycoside hydrolase family 3 C-terminal domain-containing protein [Arthrobacter sp. Cr_A7]
MTQEQDQIDGPWRSPDTPTQHRAASLLAVLTRDEKISAATGDLEPLNKYGIPVLLSQDGPNGLSLPGTTSFPSGYSLAATFDEGLAWAFGKAIGTELRGKARAVWLGPAVDITRSPYAGRQTEAFGEDPVLSGHTARAAILGAKSTHTIQTVKHFVSNNQETERIGYRRGDGDRTPGIDVRVNERALEEIYIQPFREAIRDGGADAVMCSYNRLDGVQACENKPLLDLIKSDWDGVVTPDYRWAVRDQAAAAAAGVDLPQFDQGNGGRNRDVFDSDLVTEDRLDDSVRRILTMVFSSGLFDHPLPTAARDIVSTFEHRELATRIAAEGSVLLKNDSLLPLAPAPGTRIAVIGPAAADAVFTIGGSAAVTTPVEELSTPLGAIDARSGPGITVQHAQGTRGDAPFPDSIDTHLTTTGENGQQGWSASYWNAVDRHGDPAVTRVEKQIFHDGLPDNMGEDFSARWTTNLLPEETGRHYFTLLFSGRARLLIDGTEIASGEREEIVFLAGPQLPLSGHADLAAGQPVEIVVEYTTEAAGFHTPSISLTWQPPSASGIAEAAEVASHADAAIVFANFVASEGMDRQSLALPGDQNALITAVAAANPKTIVVLNTGGAVVMPWINDVSAVVQAWYPGQMFGDAIASVLFGDVQGLGRLPVSFPQSEDVDMASGTIPESQAGALDYTEGTHVGYRWFDHAGVQPLFAFGHGLEYTSFDYSALSVTTLNEETEVQFTIRNTGARPGTATPQIYVGPAHGAGANPERILAGFGRFHLQPGETLRVAIDLPAEQLCSWLPSGAKEFSPDREYCVGESHDDLRLRADLTNASRAEA